MYHVRINGQTIGPIDGAEIARRAPRWRAVKAVVSVAPLGTQAFVPLDDFLSAPPVSMVTAAPAPGTAVRYDVRVNAQVIGPLERADVETRAIGWQKLGVPIEVADAGTDAFVPLDVFLGGAPPAAVAPASHAGGVRPRRRWIAWVSLGTAAVLVSGLVWLLARPEPAESMTTAPHITVERLPSSGTLPKRAIEEFDVSPEGVILVRIDDAVYDLTSGERVPGLGGIRSFAFVQGALLVVTAQERIAFWADGQLHEVRGVSLRASRLRASNAPDRAFVFGDAAPPYGLFSLSPNGVVHALAGSPTVIEAAAGDGQRQLFAVGRTLFALGATGRPVPLLDLPDATKKIVGLAMAGPVIYFASSDVVYELRGGLALPLVLGVGGPLRQTTDGLLVLDRSRSRLYRLVTGRR